MKTLQKGAVGVLLIFPLCDGASKPINVATATLIELKFKKPNGAIVTKTATLVNDGKDGLVSYVTEAGFLDQSRTWQVQARIVTATIDIPSAPAEFTVADNL